MGGHSRGGRGVQNVVFAGQWKLEMRPGLSAPHDTPARLIRLMIDLRYPPFGLFCEPITFDLAKSLSDAFINIGVTVPREDSAASRNEIHQALERGLHFFKILVNIGVIKFDSGKNERLWKVVQELWSLIEERGVVLVAFDDEIRTVRHGEAGPEILSDTADEEGGIAAGGVKDPREHRRRGSFAVCSCNRKNFAFG